MMKIINNIVMVFGWVLVFLIANFFDLFELISKQIDGIFYYAYSFEKFGIMAIVWRWIMLFSTIYVITMAILMLISAIKRSKV